jgi:GNAT superfamily N-acetyltransferase
MLNTESALRTVRKVLATDCACEESLFNEEGVFVVEAKEMEGRRRFPFREKTIGAVTMGTGVIISCSADRLQWARDNLGHLGRDDVFSAPSIAAMQALVSADHQIMGGPALAYVCSQDRFRPYPAPTDIEIATVHGEAVPELHDSGRFPNALGHHVDPARPRVVATVARKDGRMVGLAGASADCEEMWQIGIDVVPDCRERGVGRALVSRITEAIFDAGKLPYYGAAPSNLASRRLALSLGYLPAWTEVFTSEKPSA